MSRNAQIHALIQRFVRRFACLSLPLILAPRVMAQSNSIPPAVKPTMAQVVIVENTAATDDFRPVPDVIQTMVDKAIVNLTAKSSTHDAWASLVSSNDMVGLKVFSEPGPNSGTRVAVVAAVVRGLLSSGLPRDHIIVWDRRSVDLRLAGFYQLEQTFGVRVQGCIDAGYDEHVFYESPMLGSLQWSDLEYGKKGEGVGRKSFVSKLVSRQMTKIINISPLLHHNLVGVSGNLYSLAIGSVDNTSRFENSEETLARAVPEIYALPLLGDRVVLNIVDALICQYEGQQRGLLHYSAILNQLRFSRDPLALDVLSLEEINRQRELAGVMPNTNLDLYLNASLVEIGVSDPRRIQVQTLR